MKLHKILAELRLRNSFFLNFGLYVHIFYVSDANFLTSKTLIETF